MLKWRKAANKMAYKNKLLLTMAAAVLAAGITATAFAAPGNFSVQADELEYDLGSGEAVAKGNVVLMQYGGKRMRAGTLSIGTSHMNAAETTVGMSEMFVQGQSIFQPFLVC